MSTNEPTGVLLLQLGTPITPSVRDVRKYLAEFLWDPRVMDVAAPLRALLLYGVILPFRPRRSAEAYKLIWKDEGSPLLLHTEALTAALQERFGHGYQVEFGMRYGTPTIRSAIDRLLAAGVSEIRVLPLFPQYASSAGGSAVAKAMEILGAMWNIPPVSFLPEFYDHPGYIRAIAEVGAPDLAAFKPDHILFSYHGLPERHIKKADPAGSHCFASDSCCDEISAANQRCYRAQCFATTRLVASELELAADSRSTAFQSRLAGTPWITPQTDKVLQGLHDDGVRRLAVFTNSFVSDCLETLEEIGIRLRNQWTQLGGEDLLLIPCVNETQSWVNSVAEMVSMEARV